MNRIGEKEFKRYKNSDTIVVYGCGNSIKKLTDDDRSHLSQFDSIGFNWFCKSKIPTTFYFMREQGTKAFATKGETQGNLVSFLNRFYPKSCIICDNLTQSSPRWKKINTYSLKSVYSKYKHSGIILKELFAKNTFEEFKDKFGAGGRRQSVVSKKMMELDIFTDGLVYDFCTMTCIMHIVTYLGYDNIIFAGVDLYDHRYFWLPDNALRAITQIMGRGLETKHFTANYTCELVKEYEKTTGKNVYTFNEKSLLKDHIRVYDKSVY
jgi:hypothetical protein